VEKQSKAFLLLQDDRRRQWFGLLA
jgi:hypothetical protein